MRSSPDICRTAYDDVHGSEGKVVMMSMLVVLIITIPFVLRYFSKNAKEMNRRMAEINRGLEPYGVCGTYPRGSKLDGSHVELKSMHTAEALRGRGIGRAVLEHLTAVAVERGCDRISLETGLMDEMAASRALYASAGLTPCEPFADYPGSPNSVCMTKEL